ncbi:MAG: hypothetical protein HWE19_16700 [Vibrionaceae bacterium]|nr:hypothetical protein [Vibrionaceae bacterium]
MKVQILLTSGACPRYFGGFGQTDAGQPFVIATPQISGAQNFSLAQAQVALDKLISRWPLAQISYSAGE